MTDDAQRARRRAHNAHALERCNAMGRTAGSILWQPLQKRDGKWFMPDGAALPEPPIEWRSEKLETILDEMEETQRALAFLNDAESNTGKAYVETLDVEKWKASVDAQFFDGGAARTIAPPARIAGEEITQGDAVYVGQDGKVLRASPPEFDWVAVGPNGVMPKAEYDAFMKSSRPYVLPPPSTISLEDLEKAIMTEPTKTEPVEPMLQFFAYAHLPVHLQEISKQFGELAEDMVRILPRNPERSAGLRKLLEAKDCAVRARLYK